MGNLSRVFVSPDSRCEGVNLAKQLKTVAEEANRVSSLGTLLNTRQEQKRRTVRLGSI